MERHVLCQNSYAQFMFVPAKPAEVNRRTARHTDLRKAVDGLRVSGDVWSLRIYESEISAPVSWAKCCRKRQLRSRFIYTYMLLLAHNL